MSSRGALLVLGVIVMGGCTGLKVNKGDGAGVPYHMTKPEFVLSVAPPSAASPVPMYTIKEIYRTDFSQKYSVKADEAWLAKTKFKLQFGEQGELTSVTTQLTEQITPTIKAIGDFVVGAVGVVAKAVKAEKTPFGSLLEQLKDTTTIANVALKKSDPTPNDIQVRDNLVKKLAKLNEQYEGEVADRYIPSPDERNWFYGLQARLNDMLGDERTLIDLTEKTTYLNTKDKYIASGMCWGKLEKNYNFHKGLDELVDHRFLWIEAKESDGECKNTNGVELTELLNQANVYRQTRLRLKAVQVMVNTILGPHKKSRSQIVMDIEEKIKTLGEKLTRGDRLTRDEETGLNNLRHQWALAVGVEKEVDREATLEALLVALANRERVTAGGGLGQVPLKLMDEYQKARGELEKVRTVILAKREALLPASPVAAQLVKQELSPRVIWLGEKDHLPNGDALTRHVAKDGERYVKGDGIRFPEFLIVIEEGGNE